MSLRRMNVDLGLVSLPLGEDGRGGGGAVPQGADPDAVGRFRAALAGGGQEQAWQEAEFELLVERATGAEAAPEAEREWHGAQIGMEIERLWVANGACGARAVRVQMGQEILPDTSLQMWESGGRLQVDFLVGCEQTRTWLESELPFLARAIGQRLRRPLRLTVRGIGPSMLPSRSLDWPPAGAWG